MKTCPVWLQLGLGRAEAARILQQETAGVSEGLSISWSAGQGQPPGAAGAPEQGTGSRAGFCFRGQLSPRESRGWAGWGGCGPSGHLGAGGGPGTWRTQSGVRDPGNHCTPPPDIGNEGLWEGPEKFLESGSEASLFPLGNLALAIVPPPPRPVAAASVGDRDQDRDRG